MALFKEVKCGRCDRRYSALRSRCPHCGARKNRDGKTVSTQGDRKWTTLVFLILLVAIIAAVVILVCTALKNRAPENSGGTKTPAPSPSASAGVSTVDGKDPTGSAPPSTEPSTEPTAEPTPPVTPEPVVNSISLSREDFTLSNIGDTYTINATLSPAGTSAEIIWISENPDVATVDQNGLVTAVDHGNTIVSATAGGITKECIVRVTAYAPPKADNPGESGGSTASGDLKLSHTDVTIHYASGESFTLSVKGADSAAVIVYSSSDDSIASVSDSGVVKALSDGTATVTVKVTQNGTTETLTCVVRVKS